MWTNVKIADSTATTEDYAKRAIEVGSGILSSCEHGWQGNIWKAHKAAKENDLKLLVSAEAYWVKDRTSNDNSNCHIFIGAKNENGRRALNDVLSEANLTGYYYQPRIDVPLILSLPKDDVIVTTACVAYWKYEDIEKITEDFSNHFGKNFFLEVQYHDTPSQRALNRRIIELHNRMKIPIIMGCDSHYIHMDDALKRTDFLVSKGIEYPEEAGWYLDYPTESIAYERFAKQCILSDSEIKDAIANTNVFLDVEEYDDHIFNTDIKMPSLYPEKTQEERNNIYKNLIWFKWNQEKNKIPEENWNFYESEIQKEIDTVVTTNMSDYFIDNYHIIKKGKELGGKLTKTGRGSAPSFYTNKLLGFTDVDRIAAKVKMYPERFMSATRILESGSLPD